MNRDVRDCMVNNYLILWANTHNSPYYHITGLSKTLLTLLSVTVLQRCRPLYGAQSGDDR